MPRSSLREAVRSCPRPLLVAAVGVLVEVVVLIRFLAAELLSVSAEGTTTALTTAAFFALLAIVLVASVRALVHRVGWPRGPVLITQLIALGLAYNLRTIPAVAIAVAVLAVAVIVAMIHPESIEALAHGDDEVT